MITKVQSISYTENALSYCERGGELIHTNLCFGSASDIFKQMQQRNSFNDRCKKHTFHAKIRVAPEDKGKLTTQDWIDIGEKYAKILGFDKNLYAMYIHEEGTEKEHTHIVASRIREDNRAASDSFTYKVNLQFSEDMEREYNLRRLKRRLLLLKREKEKRENENMNENMNGKVKVKFESTDKRLLKLRAQVFKAVHMSDSLEDLEFHLSQKSIKVKKGRGISFIDQEGVQFKGSKLDRKLSLKGIEKLLAQDRYIVEESKSIFKIKKGGMSMGL